MTVLLDDIRAKFDDTAAAVAARAPRRADDPGFRDRTDAELRKLADDHFDAIVRLLTT